MCCYLAPGGRVCAAGNVLHVCRCDVFVSSRALLWVLFAIVVVVVIAGGRVDGDVRDGGVIFC